MDAEQLVVVREALSDRYRVDGLLGHGGMATVYKAVEKDTGTWVAIKVLRPELAPLGNDRFAREVHLSRDLDHPSILPTLDTGTINGLPFLVMPLVEFPSLRELLDRQGQLPISRAIDIATEIARAVGVAHAAGIVHRDIKPSNIFVGPERVILADFGIARLAEALDEDRITDSGIAVGTPGYMSPEQIAAQPQIDGRSDIYSIGCVLYEMLTGEPPFTGRSRPAIFAKQVSLPAPSVETLRDTVPVAVDEVIRRSMAKTPADRFRDSAEFIDALSVARSDSRTFESAGRAPKGRRRIITATSIAVLATGVLIVALSLPRPSATLDEGAYVVVPFEHGPDVETRVPPGQVRDVLSRWSDISPVDGASIDQRLGERDAGALTPGRAGEIARELGAMWVVQGELLGLGDSVRLELTLADARLDGPGVVQQSSVRIPRSATVDDSTLARAVDALLLGGRAVPERRSLATTSLAARRTFMDAENAISRWELETADSLFTQAFLVDPDFAEAHLWAAVTRWWSGQAMPLWTIPVQQAVARASSMGVRDRQVAEAMAALVEGEAIEACERWESLTSRHPFDFAAWYGTARCLQFDNTVVPDPDSPSGWSFRTSYHHALEAYRTAFELQPSILSAFSEESYTGLLRLLQAGSNQRRPGASEGPTSQRFVADPAWIGDSLAMVPYPMEEAVSNLTTSAERIQAATLNQRRLFLEIAGSWSRSDPQSVDARRALAVGLSVIGDRAALDSLSSAYGLATTAEDRTELRITEVWMRLRFGLPADTIAIRRAKVLADSILLDPAATEADPWRVAAIAALTGRANLAAQLATAPSVRESLDIEPPLGSDPARLLVFAALGGPVDSLTVLEQRITQRIHRLLPEESWNRALRRWVVRSATLAFPVHTFQAFHELDIRGDYLWDIQSAYLRGDPDSARAGLARIEEIRSELALVPITFDALYPEAALLDELGDHEQLVRWLDPTLMSLPTATPSLLEQPPLAASLIHVIALRARAADALADTTGARAWRSAIRILWTGADPLLRPIMEDLLAVAH